MEKGKLVAFDPNFSNAVGVFYGAWGTLEITIDYALGKFLGLPFEETHLLTAGMDFNRKANLLRVLIARNESPKQTQLIGALNTVQNESLRNVFAHSFLKSDETTVSFVERSRHGKYVANAHTFTLQEFKDHVKTFVLAGRDFYHALEVDESDFADFCNAALSVRTSAPKSPTPPSSSA